VKYHNQEHATEYLRDNEPEPHCDRPEREPDWEWGPDCDPPEPCERCGGKWLIKTSVRRDLLEAVCQDYQSDRDTEKPLTFRMPTKIKIQTMAVRASIHQPDGARRGQRARRSGFDQREPARRDSLLRRLLLDAPAMRGRGAAQTHRGFRCSRLAAASRQKRLSKITNAGNCSEPTCRYT
jgi:hypothetical protein